MSYQNDATTSYGNVPWSHHIHDRLLNVFQVHSVFPVQLLRKNEDYCQFFYLKINCIRGSVHITLSVAHFAKKKSHLNANYADLKARKK